MMRTIEAMIDEHGKVSLSERIHLPTARRALVTILEEDPALQVTTEAVVNEAALLAESALAEDWNRPEEDAAWRHLKDLPVLNEENR